MRNDFAAGDWDVLLSRNLLVRGGEEVRVEPRVMDVLVLLADRADGIVSKEELIERVWQGRFVSDDVLTVTIYALRKALGDDAKKPRYIETVSRRGYRLIAPVKTAAPEAVLQNAARPRAPWWRIAAVAATVAIALFAIGAARMLTLPHRGRHVATAEAHECYVKGRFFLDQ